MNKAKDLCPECKQTLMTNHSHCTCGWQVVKKNYDQVRDYRCQYQAVGKRCTRIGTICPFTHGNGPWYCSGHWQALNDPLKGQALLLEAEATPNLIGLKDNWRASLFKTII